MRWRVLLGCLVVGCSGGSLPPGEPPSADVVAAPPRGAGASSRPNASPVVADDGSGIRVLLDHPAASAIAAPDRVLVLESDFLHLTAVLPATGAEIWRTKLQDDASGQHDLALRGKELVVKAGDKLFFVDPFSGQVLRRAEDVPHCPFVEEHGACGYQCDCTLFVASCSDGKELTHFNGDVIHVYHDLSQPHDNVCAFTPHVVGASGKHLVVVAQGSEAHGMGADGTVVVLDAATGRELRRGPVVSRWRNDVGVVPETGGCWIASEDTGALVMHDCASGAVRWRARVGADADQASMTVTSTAEGIFVRRVEQSGTDMALFDRVTGKRVWQRKLAPGTSPFAADEEPGAVYISEARAHELVDRADGKTLATFALAEEQSLARDGAGFVITGAGILRELDAHGQSTRTLDYRGDSLARLTRTHLVETDRGAQAEARFLRRSDLGVARRLPGTFSVLPSAGLDERYVLLYRHHEEGLGEVVLVELAP